MEKKSTSFFFPRDIFPFAFMSLKLGYSKIAFAFMFWKIRLKFILAQATRSVERVRPFRRGQCCFKFSAISNIERARRKFPTQNVQACSLCFQI